MSKLHRINSVLVSVVIILMGLTLMIYPVKGYPFVVLILTLALLFGGIRRIVYYFTMARHMVDGKPILYTGLIFLDLGIFTGSLSDLPQMYVMLYILVIHLVAGVIDCLRAREAKQYAAPSWKWTLALGIANIAIAVLCVIFIRSISMVVLLYGLGLISNGVVRLIRALRRTEIVYIP